MERVSFDTELGPLTLTEDDGAIVRIEFRDGKAAGRSLVLSEAKRQLREYAAGDRDTFTFPYRWAGTPFQDRVWKTLEAIPFGGLLSYGEVAEKVGRPGGARAVGGAVGSNPLPLVVPCHRVIASNAKLGGFGPGSAWKRRLLKLEGSLERVRD